MTIERLAPNFSVCKLESANGIPKGKFVFYAETDEERSLVCPTGIVPAKTLAREDGFRAFRVSGVLDFSLIGILSKISGALAEEKIGLFAVSTYNTDYILVKKESFDRALKTLEKAGFEIA